MEFNWNDKDFNFDFIVDVQDELNLNEKNEAVVFLVDYASLSFVNHGLKMTNTEIIADSYQNLVKRKLIAAPLDKVGLILYNSV